MTGSAAHISNSISSDRQIIMLRDLYKHYVMGDQTVRALDGLDLDILDGQFWAVMGASGSGKSTLLNILGCLDRPTMGMYHLVEQDVSQLNDQQLSETRLRRIGFIFQSFNLIAQLTVQENIELPLYYLGWEPRRSAERAAELAEMVGLEERLDHRPQQLSGGQQQRVAIARALANDPAMLLADEPTGNLDSATGQMIMELLRSLHEQGKTIVMVTHEPEIADWAQVRLYMKDGRMDRIETASEIQPTP